MRHNHSHGRHGHNHGNEIADKWTNISSLAEFGTSFVSNFIWIAGLADVVTGADPEFLGFSYIALGIGVGVAALNATGSFYSHRILNTRNQTIASSNLVETGINTNENPHEHASLTWGQQLALGGDYLSHTGDRAGFINTVVDAATKGTLSRWQRGLVYGAGTLFGLVASIADLRTCKNSVHAHNEQSTPSDVTPLLQN